MEIKVINLADRSEYILQANKLGENIMLCPVCSHQRKKKTDKCFSFNLSKSAGRCNHCQVVLVEKRDNSVVRTVAYSKSLKDYKAMPRHIKAMLIWNELVNEDFRMGSKGKLWDLRAIDINKAPEHIKANFHNKLLKKYQLADVDCVCLPEEVNVLPDYFIPDIKKIVSYACDDRIANLVEPLWQESQQILLF
jgi:hypothetical protein